MNKVFKKFDMKAPPIRQRQWLRPVTWALSFPFVAMQHTKIIKTNCEGLKPPYILLCNHNGFYDFQVATCAIFPDRANYVVAIDGFFGFPLKKMDLAPGWRYLQAQIHNRPYAYSPH